MNIKTQVAELLSTLLNIKINPLDDISTNTISSWDSMKHLEIITTIEEELNISFEIEDIPSLTSMAEIVKKIEAMH